MNVAAFGSISRPAGQRDYSRLDTIISLGFTILLSDGAGTDEEIQAHVAALGYTNVVVYHNGARGGLPRRNLGGWPTVLVHGSYTDKDARMCSDCDAGLAYWNGRSRGTRRNIEQLRGEGKKVRVVTPCEARPDTPAGGDDLATALLEDAGGM